MTWNLRSKSHNPPDCGSIQSHYAGTLEGDIGYVKKNSRVDMLAANVPTRFGHRLQLTLYTKRITYGTPKIRLESGQRRTSA